MFYRVAALPAAHVTISDVLIVDRAGRHYLLSQEEPVPRRIDPGEVNMLGQFFEPTQVVAWHDEDDLRRILFGLQPERSASLRISDPIPEIPGVDDLMLPDDQHLASAI